jgi:hypothetical protein
MIAFAGYGVFVGTAFERDVVAFCSSNALL